MYLGKKRESFHFCLVALILGEDFYTNVLKKYITIGKFFLSPKEDSITCLFTYM